jgi:predicted nucleic acid-binding protein
VTFSSCLSEEDRQLVLDSSVVINLLASGHPAPILEALPMPIVVTENVVLEIKRAVAANRKDIEQLNELIANEVVAVGQLRETALEHFVELVSGGTAESLGDGEAATLAFAHGARSSAAIDEKKATRIAASRFASLRLATTIDILSFEAVGEALGQARLEQAMLQALRLARMQVREHQFDWVVGVIGSENILACTSLKRIASHRVRLARVKVVS